jgi:serine/threonine-protein kinase
MMPNSEIGKEEIPFGTIIDNRYLIQKVLGQGGLGRTYLAFDTHRFNEPCVLKEFAPLGSGQYDLEKSRDLFKREAKILHQICHPQIPKFLACFEGKGRLFLVQEYVKGKTYSALLQQRQQQGKPFSELEVIVWLMNLLPILKYIHDRGIIHRDISPDNIMQPDGEELPVLIDFGVGKLTNAAYRGENTGIKQANHSYVGKMSFVGKIGYAPREQITMGICSPSSDIYSLGVTAIVLLTGREPTMLLDQYSLEWEWRKYVQVSNNVGAILDKMIEDRPRHRYQLAPEVLLDLQQLNINQETISNFQIFAPATPKSAAKAEDVQLRQAPIEPEEETVIVYRSASSSHSLKESSSNPPLSQSTEDTHFISDIPNVKEQPLPKSSTFSQPIEETMIVDVSNSSTSRLSSPQTSQGKTKSNPSLGQRTPLTSLSSNFIKRCQQELAYCIGPMASLIVEEVMIQYNPQSPQELVNALAEQIPDPKKAIQFKQRLF